MIRLFNCRSNKNSAVIVVCQLKANAGKQNDLIRAVDFGLLDDLDLTLLELVVMSQNSLIKKADVV